VDAATAKARVDVVVFFRRAPSAEEEVPFILTNSGLRTYTLSPIPQQDWPYPTPYPSPYPEPFLKRSGFMLSTSTGTWHRLAAVDEGSLTIKIERGSPNLNGSHAVFMRGVIDVYPLGQKP